MKPFATIVFSIFLLFFSTKVKAQNQDYVITIKGDTLKCIIKGDPGSRYKTGTMNRFTWISTDQIKEYYTSNTNTSYRAIQLIFKPVCCE